MAGANSQDWTKYAIINPARTLIFKENKEDGKAFSTLEIINKSQNEHILFRVKIN
jgi:hypothetical protein